MQCYYRDTTPPRVRYNTFFSFSSCLFEYLLSMRDIILANK
jgi:hypothetical protein